MARGLELAPRLCVCARIVERHGKSKALEGLRRAANDIIVEDLGDRPGEGIVVLDEPIVKRGCIRDDLEYYLVNGIVVDLGNTLPDKERAML